MRRLLILLAAAPLLLASPAHSTAPAKDQASMQNGGNADHGSSWDNSFAAQNHYMYASWDRGNQYPVSSGDAVWSEITLRIDTNGLPDTVDGHNVCVQVAIDWRVPVNANHYDSRILRNCDPNSSATWTFSERATDNHPADCYINTAGGPVTVPCSSPMGRVQFARFDAVANHVLSGSTMDCRTMAGIEGHDCTSWDPWGSVGFNASRLKIRYRDGSSQVVGSLDATNPNG